MNPENLLPGRGGKRPGAGRKLSPKKLAKRLSEQMRIDAGKEAFMCELDMMRDHRITPGIRMGCAQDIQDRIFGKAKQMVEHSGEINLIWENILKRSWADLPQRKELLQSNNGHESA